jgi:PAT family beta-lactamase induction signal transducer AmpG
MDFIRRFGFPIAALTCSYLIFKVPEQATIGGIMSPFIATWVHPVPDRGHHKNLRVCGIGIVGYFSAAAAVARWGRVGTAASRHHRLWLQQNMAYLILPLHQGDLVALSW